MKNIKISELAKSILEISNTDKDLTFVKGTIKEQLILKKYNKQIDEGYYDQESKPIVGKDNIPSEEDNIQQEPETPEATVDVEIDKGPIIISATQAIELLSYKGKIGSAIFTKKDGTRRAMNFMTSVRKHTKGGELPYNPKEKGLIPVYDLKIGNGAAGYRMINISGLEHLKMNGKEYKIDQSLNEVKVVSGTNKYKITINTQSNGIWFIDDKEFKNLNSINHDVYKKYNDSNDVIIIIYNPEYNSFFENKLKQLNIKYTTPSIGIYEIKEEYITTI